MNKDIVLDNLFHNVLHDVAFTDEYNIRNKVSGFTPHWKEGYWTILSIEIHTGQWQPVIETIRLIISHLFGKRDLEQSFSKSSV